MIGQTIRVLFIEDDIEDFELFQFMFDRNTQVHFDARHVMTLEEGLQVLSDAEIDVVLLDLFLPDSAGFEGIQRVVAHSPHVPVVVLTGLGDESMGTRAVTAGAEDYLVKGEANSTTLTRTIFHAIERHQRVTGETPVPVPIEASADSADSEAGSVPLSERSTIVQPPPERRSGSRRWKKKTPTGRRQASGDSVGSLQRLGDFLIERKIGKGGMGVVFLATQLSLKRKVALKVVSSSLAEDKTFCQRFLREARAAASLAHPHVIQVFTVGIDDDTGRLYFAMEFVEGRNLNEVLEQDAALSFGGIMRIMIAVASALEHAWEHHLVHRDIKPSNIMLGPKGQVKVLDFGLAKSMDHSKGLTRTGAMIGSPDYMSPEHAGSGTDPDCRSDLYSLGLVLYRMLAGSCAFAGDSIASLIFLHSFGSPRAINPARPNVPEAFDRLLETLLAKKPEERIENPRTLVTVLRELHERLLQDGLLDERPQGRPVQSVTFWEVQGGQAEDEILNTRTVPPTESGLHRALLAIRPKAPSEPQRRLQPWLWVVGLALLLAMLSGLGLAWMHVNGGNDGRWTAPVPAWTPGIPLMGSGTSDWRLEGETLVARRRGYLAAGSRVGAWRLRGEFLERGAAIYGVYLDVNGELYAGLLIDSSDGAAICKVVEYEADGEKEILRAGVGQVESGLSFAVSVDKQRCLFELAGQPIAEIPLPIGAYGFVLFADTGTAEAAFHKLEVLRQASTEP